MADRLVLLTTELGIGNACVAPVHTFVSALGTGAKGLLTLKQDNNSDFEFVVEGNVRANVNLGVAGNLSIGNQFQATALAASSVTVGAGGLVVTGNTTSTAPVTMTGNVTIGDADLFRFRTAPSNAIVLGNTMTIQQNIKTVSIDGNVSVSGTVAAANIVANGDDLKLRIDNFMRSTKRIYVKTTGNDANDGTSWDRAVLTIKRAAVLALSGTTIYVETGEYLEDNPIRIRSKVAVIGDNLRVTILRAQNPRLDYFHVDNLDYIYGFRFLDLRRPAFCAAFPCAIAEAVRDNDSITRIDVLYSPSGYTTPPTIIIQSPEGTGGVRATATAILTNTVITSIQIVSGGSGYVTRPHISIPSPSRPFITGSPYVQNCSSITGPFDKTGVKISEFTPLPYDTELLQVDDEGAGGGCRIDGAVCAPGSPLRSFVSDSFTQVNQGGPGHLVINLGYAQFVSSFTTFCSYAFKSVDGGITNISTSVTDFGTDGLVATGYWHEPIAQGKVTQNYRSTVASITITNGGSGYVTAPTVVFSSGTATATVTLNNGAVASIAIVDGGAYETVPTITFSGGSPATAATGTVVLSGVNPIQMDTFKVVTSLAITNGGAGYMIAPTVVFSPVGATATATIAGGQVTAITVTSGGSYATAPTVTFVGGSPTTTAVATAVLSGRVPDYGSAVYYKDAWRYVIGKPVQIGNSASTVYTVELFPVAASANINDIFQFYTCSVVSTGQHVMEYHGSGVTYNALPEYGGSPAFGDETREVAPGKVYSAITDHVGNLKIGKLFGVEQLSGKVTISTDKFDLSGLEALGPFKRNGVVSGVKIEEVSDNPNLTSTNDATTVPTQSAVKTYVNERSVPSGGLKNSALVKTSDDQRAYAWVPVVLTAEKNAANGVPSLDSAARIVGNGSVISSLNATNVTLGTLSIARGGTGASAATGTGNVVLDVSPVIKGVDTQIEQLGVGRSPSYPLDVAGNVRVTKCLYMGDQVANNIICLAGDTNSESANVFGLGLNTNTLRYNSARNHTWYANTVNTMTLSNVGALTAASFACSADTNNVISPGTLVLRNAAPTISMRHTTANSAFFLCSANLLYVLRGANDATTWSAVNGQWPCYWNLVNNDALFGGNVSAVGDVTASASDERLKTNIRPLTNSLDIIKKLRGVRFDWRDETPQPMRGADVGLIAQDVIKVIPEAVKPAPFDTDESGVSKSGMEYLTIDTGNKIIAVLVEAVKELAAEIEDLKSQRNAR